MQQSKQSLLKSIFLFFVSIFLFQACKKADIVNSINENPPVTVIQQPKDFFTISVNAPNALKTIVKEMQKQFKENDVRDFLEWHGQPLWNKIIKFQKGKHGAITYAIPIQKSEEITGFFAATIDSLNNIQFEMHRRTAISLKKTEYTYSDISLSKSKTILNIFSNNSKRQDTEETNSLIHCSWKWVPQETFQKTSTSNMECACGHWEWYCEDTGPGGTGGSGGGTGGGDPGGGGTGSGGCGGGGGGNETFTGKWWSNEASLLSPCELIEVVNRLTALLGLNTAQRFFLTQYPERTEEIDRYVGGGGNQQTNQIAYDHLVKMTDYFDYNNFVVNHAITGDPQKMWWEDDTWLDDPNNFNLDLTRSSSPAYKLTAAEKALVIIFPVQAFVIYENIDIALAESDRIYGANSGSVNTKKDAFRHAFFNAINTRDVPARVLPPVMLASQIVELFGIAHESDVPTVLNLGKDMDLFNNEVGIDYCWNCYTGITSNSTISNAILAKLSAGELKYLDPLDFILHPLYDSDGDGIQDCATCTDGIYSATVLKPTNQ